VPTEWLLVIDYGLMITSIEVDSHQKMVQWDQVHPLLHSPHHFERFSLALGLIFVVLGGIVGPMGERNWINQCRDFYSFFEE
jgi:hypothetical protein